MPNGRCKLHGGKSTGPRTTSRADAPPWRANEHRK
jgi:hypothetical protein